MPNADSNPTEWPDLIEVLVDPRIGPPPPSPLAGVPAYDDRDHAAWWPGELTAWRWVDREGGMWVGLVSYTRGIGLRYLHWVPGHRLRRLDGA